MDVFIKIAAFHVLCACIFILYVLLGDIPSAPIDEDNDDGSI
jgi:hypothetical protein